MNREEAINFANCLKNNYTVDLNDMEAFCDMAIKALEQEPTTKNNLGVDCISRQAVEDAMYDATRSMDLNYGQIMEYIDNLPSVTPQLSVPEVTALAEWTEKLTKASEDAYNKGYADGIKAQEPRKGHWLRRPHVYGVTYCSVCDFELKIDNTNYCPNCGAKMESEVEDGND
jgi:rubrerythrin